jgi:hypothetical protein
MEEGSHGGDRLSVQVFKIRQQRLPRYPYARSVGMGPSACASDSHTVLQGQVGQSAEHDWTEVINLWQDVEVNLCKMSKSTCQRSVAEICSPVCPS